MVESPGQTPADGAGATISRRKLLGAAGFLGVAALPGAGVLAGCSGGTKSSGSGSGSGAVKDSLAIPGGPKTTPRGDILYPSGYVGPRAATKGPVTKGGKKVTLKVVVQQSPEAGNWTNNAFTKWYEEQTHVHIDWQVVASGDDTMTKVNAMIASGDLPDAFMSIPFTPSQLYVYGQQGLFIDQKQILKTYCPETQRVFKDYPETEKLLTAPDGNIYSSPYVNDCYHCKYSPSVWLYRPWLDKLGLKEPETTDDFVKVLQAFKTRNPNGKGDVIPMSGSSGDLMSDYFMGSFLYNPGDPWLFLNNGKVDIAVNKPEWREGWRYIRSLVKQGLIDERAFTQTSEQLQRQGNKSGPPTMGVVRGYYWASFMNINDDDPKASFRDYHSMAPLQGPGGVRVSAWNYYNWLGVTNFVITKSCKNPAVAAMWADSQKELGNMLRAYSGVEGKDWRYAKKGEKGIDGNQALWTTQGTWPPPNGQWWAQMGVDYRSMDFRNGELVDPKAPTFEKQFYDDTKNAYYPHRVDKKKQLPPLSLDNDQAAVVADSNVPITNKVKQMESQFCLGKSDIDDDKQWNAYVEEIKKIGVERYLQAYQDAYDAWTKATEGK
ncbi:extracellular solute-binding protein [Actinopolymorpha rutila]|uniref:Putative aldouronate transport system substrate-binding protein n=1 Tax=Actinopolymorpha rutila TaxID=446787 RepID=A0A852ZLA5_9ACTN|nr:extracellular solute-binding protein [Actinopolymorpha rutila]NYH89980.1 putative aldouronate transport system substrate-binding protein [Actinopolymorpha rutila]